MPGNLDESELVARITAEDETDRMPPKSLGRTLTPREIDLLKRWVEQGAEWKDHWAFIPPGEAPLPEVRHSAWPRNAIDRFVLARLEAEGLTPSPEASKERLIRRVTFDLTGLPPTLAEIDAIPGRLPARRLRTAGGPAAGLAPIWRATWPSTGWTWHAMPTPTGIRPTSTAPCGPGATGSSRRSIRTSRSTSSSPGSLPATSCPRPTREQVLATAFNRHHRQTNEGGSIEEEWRTEYVADRTITFGAAFLGLTLECSRCHDHKYDPITQKDFYSLSSFFNSIDESGLYSHFTDAVPTPTALLSTDDTDRAIAATERKIHEAEAELERLGPTRSRMFEAWLRGLNRESQTPPIMSGRIGDFPLDEIKNLKVENQADPTQTRPGLRGPGTRRGANRQGLEAQRREQRHASHGQFRPVRTVLDRPLDQDPGLEGPGGGDPSLAGLDRCRQPGLRDPDRGRQAERHLVHFWPGNAIGITTKAAIPLDRWVHVTMTYDGSSRAGGLRLYLDGRRADCKVVRDSLTKNITGGGGDELTVGQRFRDRGFKNGFVDEINVFDRALTPLEVAQLGDGTTLSKALRRDPATFTPELRQALFAYYLANFDAEYIARLADLKELRRQRSAPGRSGRRDHGHEGAAAAPADVRPACAVRTMRRPNRLHAILRRPCFPSRRTGQGTGWAGPLGDRPQAAADGAGHRQPLVAVDLRPGNRGHARRLRQPGAASLASRTARLAGASLHRFGLGREEPLAADRDLRDLPASLGSLDPSFRPAILKTSCSVGVRGCGSPPR